MTRVLQAVNFLGVIALALLCAAQWRANRRVNLEAEALDRTRQRQAVTIADRDRAIRGYVADLDELRQRLTTAEGQLKELNDKLTAVAADRDHIAAERDQIAKQRDQLKASLEQWQAAVATRDAAIKRTGSEVQKLATERNEAVLRFNDLAGKYNALVRAAEGATSRPAAAASQ